MNINYKKSAKLVVLLISTLLIATASAAVYNYMYQNATIGVEGMTLEWITGDDSTEAGTQINGATCTLTNLKGPANGTRTYSDPVRLNSTGATATDFDLLIDQVTGDNGQMDSIVVRIYSLNTTTYIQNVTLWDGSKGSDPPSMSIPADHMWRFEWEIKWKSTATTLHTVSVYLKVRVAV